MASAAIFQAPFGPEVFGEMDSALSEGKRTNVATGARAVKRRQLEGAHHRRAEIVLRRVNLPESLLLATGDDHKVIAEPARFRPVAAPTSSSDGLSEYTDEPSRADSFPYEASDGAKEWLRPGDNDQHRAQAAAQLQNDSRKPELV